MAVCRQSSSDDGAATPEMMVDQMAEDMQQDAIDSSVLLGFFF